MSSLYKETNISPYPNDFPKSYYDIEEAQKDFIYKMNEKYRYTPMDTWTLQNMKFDCANFARELNAQFIHPGHTTYDVSIRDDTKYGSITIDIVLQENPEYKKRKESLYQTIINEQLQEKAQEPKTTIQNILDNKNYFAYHQLANYFINAGYTQDYVIGFNVLQNGDFVLSKIPNANPDDVIWLCNKIANLTRKKNTSNFRLAFQKKSYEYINLYNKGGLGNAYDDLITNPKTGNSFWLGFHYTQD